MNRGRWGKTLGWGRGCCGGRPDLPLSARKLFVRPTPLGCRPAPGYRRGPPLANPRATPRLAKPRENPCSSTAENEQSRSAAGSQSTRTMLKKNGRTTATSDVVQPIVAYAGSRPQEFLWCLNPRRKWPKNKQDSQEYGL